MEADAVLAHTRALMPMSKKTKAMHALLALRDNGMRCAYCLVERRSDELVREHVVPHSRGGSNAHTNRVLSCAPCDRDKGPRTPQEWKPGRVWGNPVIDNAHQPPPLAKFQKERKQQKPPLPATSVRRHRHGMVYAAFTQIVFCFTCDRAVDLSRGHPEKHNMALGHEPNDVR